MIKNNQKFCEYSCIPYNKVAYPIQQSCINNIEENIDNTNTNVLVEEPTITDVVTIPKKKNLYEKCVDEIDKFTDLPDLRDALIEYLTLRLSMKDKPIYGVNQWKALLKKLDKCVEECMRDYIDIVNQSIERGYASFFPINDKPWNTKGVKGMATEQGVKSVRATEEELREQEEFRKKMVADGKRVEF